MYYSVFFRINSEFYMVRLRIICYQDKLTIKSLPLSVRLITEGESKYPLELTHFKTDDSLLHIKLFAGINLLGAIY